MAAWIDRIALLTVSAIGYYLFFLNAWGSVPQACGAAFVCCALTRHIVRALPRGRRIGRAQARTELLRIAGLPDEEAAALLEALLRRRYPDEDFRLTAALKHPDAALSCGDVLAAWKANRDAGRLVIAATCPCESGALLYARELRDPLVAVADRRALERLLRRGGMAAAAPPARASLLSRLRRAAASFCAARFSPRSALLAAALLALYLIRGNPLNLFAALALFAHLGIALGQRRIGKRLFD